MLLEHYQNQANGQLFWQEPGDDMGFSLKPFDGARGSDACP